MHLYPLVKGIFIGLIIAIPTGPVGFICAKRAITHHYRASIASALGSISADVIFGSIAIFGLTLITNFFTHEQNFIRFFGGLLLVYVGIKTFFDIHVCLNFFAKGNVGISIARRRHRKDDAPEHEFQKSDFHRSGQFPNRPDVPETERNHSSRNA